MNIKRGLFRVWLVSALLFMVATAAFSYNDIVSHFDSSYILDEIPPNGEAEVPVLCGETKSNTGFRMEKGKSGAWLCWYTISKYRALYQSYEDLNDGQLVIKLHQQVGAPIILTSPWTVLGNAVASAIGWPIALLAIGAAIYWAFAGFARSPVGGEHQR
jgi:hypothetical protein